MVVGAAVGVYRLAGGCSSCRGVVFGVMSSQSEPDSSSACTLRNLVEGKCTVICDCKNVFK